MTDDIVIKIDDLWKRYGLPLASAVRGLANRLRKNRRSIANDGGPWALQDVSFEVKRGETLGIIGRNGAGKSTLLKILAGVTPPTRGQIAVRGRVFPMIELNAGIHPELTGRENVRLLGAIMGLSRKEVEAKISEIEEFTELEGWFDQPVRKYSSGMLARLGFGVGLNVRSDVLLIDEILAVGDMAFQFKCHQHIARLRDEGKTILFVSHNLNMIRNLCNRVILLHQGIVKSQGDKEAIVSAYRENTTESVVEMLSPVELKSDICGIVDVTFLKLDGTHCDNFSVGEGMIIKVRYKSEVLLKKPAVVIALYSMIDVNTVAAGFNTWEDRLEGHELYGEGSFELHIRELNLMPATYFVNVVIHQAERYPMIARSRGKYTFRLSSEIQTVGVARLKHSWQFNVRN